nr:MAG TPA: hypothetical protein [Caudoviricetes sp.]
MICFRRSSSLICSRLLLCTCSVIIPFLRPSSVLEQAFHFIRLL